MGRVVIRNDKYNWQLHGEPPYYPGKHEPPMPAYDFEQLDTENAKIMLRLTPDEFNSLANGWPVVVEMWDKFSGPHSYGRARRRWLAEFGEQDRRRAGRLHIKFRRWYLRSGLPQNIVMSAGTIAFARRLIQFAASL